MSQRCIGIELRSLPPNEPNVEEFQWELQAVKILWDSVDPIE